MCKKDKVPQHFHHINSVRRFIKYFSITVLVFTVSSLVSYSQNLEKIGKKDMVKISGGVNYSSVFYKVSGIDSRRDPFTWYLSGNINVSIIDFSIPLNYTYSNQRGTFSQPFNQISLAPSYKWIKGYAGYTSMIFSPYTLSGHTFLGGGLDLNPSRWKFAAIYGQFKKPVPYDAIGGDATMSYRRMGQGLKVGYEREDRAVFINYFSAQDDPFSIPFIPEGTVIIPMSNAVLSINGRARILKVLKVEGEYAVSGLTRNVLAEKENSPDKKNYLPGIFKLKTSSEFFAALKSSLGFQEKKYGLMINYERIDPGYQTLGAYYFRNDLENITLAPSANICNGKLNISFNTGFERNNLDASRLTSTKRWIGSAAIIFAPNQKWILNINYSNFNSFIRQRPQTDPFSKNMLDTLNFFQITRSMIGSAVHSFGNSESKSTIMLNASSQLIAELSGTVSEPGFIGSISGSMVPSYVYSGNVGYSVARVKSQSSLSFFFNAKKSEMQGVSTLYFGPNLNFGKAVMKNKMKLNAGISYNRVLLNGYASNSVVNYRMGYSYTPKFKNEKIGKFSASVNTSYLHKLKVSSSSISFREFTGNLGLNYGF